MLVVKKQFLRLKYDVNYVKW